MGYHGFRDVWRRKGRRGPEGLRAPAERLAERAPPHSRVLEKR